MFGQTFSDFHIGQIRTLALTKILEGTVVSCNPYIVAWANQEFSLVNNNNKDLLVP